LHCHRAGIKGAASLPKELLGASIEDDAFSTSGLESELVYSSGINSLG